MHALLAKKVTVLGSRLDWSITPETNDAYNCCLRDIVFTRRLSQPAPLGAPVLAASRGESKTGELTELPEQRLTCLPRSGLL